MHKKNSYQTVGDVNEYLTASWVIRSTEIANKIIGILMERNMMQKELATRVGLRPQQVSRILRGNTNLTIKTIVKLEHALGVRLIEVSGERPEVIEIRSEI